MEYKMDFYIYLSPYKINVQKDTQYFIPHFPDVRHNFRTGFVLSEFNFRKRIRCCTAYIPSQTYRFTLMFGFIRHLTKVYIDIRYLERNSFGKGLSILPGHLAMEV